MKYKTLMLILMSISCSTAFAEKKFLETVESDVIETPGTVKEIAGKGKTCIAQIVRNEAGGDTIVDTDLEGGTITANSTVYYSGGLTVKPLVKSTLTFMAKEGRFKMRHANIERQFDSNSTWEPIGIYWGSGAKSAEESLREVFTKIAGCVKGGGGKEENW